MERAALMKRSCMAPSGLSLHHVSSLTKSSSCPPTSSSTIPQSFLRVSAMALSSEDFTGLQWQPVFKLDQADLLAEAPSLLRCCEGLDWKARANELRTLAKSSLSNISNNKNLQSEPKDIRESMGNDSGDAWFAAGLASATATLAQCCFHLNAFAAEESLQQDVSADAASRAPGWLTPALLAFPVVSYVIFNVYRDQVNPNAKVMDWMFGVAAFVIIANLVLIATIGVRLY